MLSLLYGSFPRMLGFCLFVLFFYTWSQPKDREAVVLFFKDMFLKKKKKIEQVDLGLYGRPRWPRTVRDPFVSTS